MSPKTLLTTSRRPASVRTARTITIAFGLGLSALGITHAQIQKVGIGADHPAAGVDGAGSRMNIEDSGPATRPNLAAGEYRVVDFRYANSADIGDIQPFLATSTGPDTYSVIWVGPTEPAPGTDTTVTKTYAAETFALASAADVYAGFNAGGPNVKFGAGQTDHANPANFAITTGTPISGFGHANLARSYAFEINVEPGTTGDNDNDGLPEFWETANGLDDNDDGTTGESAPGLKDGPNGALGDPDNDDLSNEDEFANGTDPQNPDSDGDGVNDGAEILNGTLPDNPDTDNDGLTDGEEATLGTDPNNPDSDGDGRTDGNEVTAGSDPNDPNSPGTIKIGFGPNLVGITDTVSDGVTNQMRQNINITDTVFLDEGTYQALSWEYNAAADLTNGGTQPVFPFLTIVNGPADHTVLAFGATIDTEPGIQLQVPFGDENSVFTIPPGGATVAAGIQNPSAPGVTNSILTDLSFGTTDHANSALFDEAGSVGANLLSFGHANLARTYAFAIDVGSPDTSKLQLDIDQVGGDLVIAWPSALGKLYNLRSETDPSNGNPGTWPIYAGNEDIVATPDTNTLTLPFPPELERYFVIEEFNAPPVAIFEDDFETGQGAWVVSGGGTTNWEVGAPGAPGPAAANSGVSCFGTNLTANYTSDANVSLRSPAIDLTAAGDATLRYAEFRDIETMFDSGTINILNAADNSLITVLESGIEGDTGGAWENVSKPLPAAALGNLIKIEFVFTSDNFGDFAGWYIDDFSVTIP